MLYKAKTLHGYKLDSLNGVIGKAQEFYFDDQYWAIRYLVADSGNWLTGRRVLLSPYALVGVSNEEQHILVNLTKKQIEDSPSLESDKPVSRQFEEAYYGYYDWPIYWGGPNMWGNYPDIVRDHEKWREYNGGENPWDPHLRSTNAVRGYHIQSSDGEIGHVEDFIVDEETWAIRYLIVDTKNWWPGKKVLLSTKWIERVSWSESKIFVNLTREIIRQSPEFIDELLLSREYEAGLHGHYNRQGYWIEELAAKERSLEQERGVTL
jgi:sporulation protein YlmC with PRC-barrel domain